MKRRTLLYAQSGGVTAVINASAGGVIETARKHRARVVAGRNGIIGALTEDLIDTSREPAAAIARAEAHAGQRVRLVPLQAQGPLERDRAQYERLIDVFRAHDIGYFFYNGGNDSADTCLKVSQIATTLGYPLACTCRRPSTTISRSPTTAPASARSPSTSRLDARGGVRRRLDGKDLDQGVRARSDGPPRRLDHRRVRARGRTRMRRRRSCSSRRSRSTRRGSSRRCARRSSGSAIARSASPKGCATPTAS